MASSYAGLPSPFATATAAANANKVNVVGPGGTGTWTPSKGGGPATYTVSQNPLLKNAQYTTDRTYAAAAKGASGVLAKPTLDTSKLADMPVNAGMTGQNAIMQRLSPQIQRERDALHTQLTNWGLQPGTEAYDQAMQRQSERENDLLNQAAVSGINLDMNARQQGVNEQVTGLNLPADILAKLEGRTSAPPTAPGGGVAGSTPDLMGAWNAMNNSNIAAQNRSAQNYTDWLNLAGTGLRAAPDLIDAGAKYGPQIRDWINDLWGP